MSLHGTLETFALPDVMALLAATKKTGELRVVGGKLDGRVHMDAGRVIAADVGRADSFVDAVFELLRLTSGKFSFDADNAPENAGDPVDVEPLLLEAQSRLEAWREIEAVVPSMDHGVVLVTDLSDPHVTLASDQWRMVVAVAGAACVHEVADHLGLGEYAVCKALKDLVESGVVAVSDPPAPKKVEAKAEVKVEAKLEKVEPEAKAEPAPQPEKAEKADKDKAEDEDKADKADKAKAEKAAKDDKAESAPVIEPKLTPKPLPETPVEVPALSQADSMSPAAPGEEPEEAKPAPKKVAATTSGTGSGNGKPVVDPSQAKQLVSQLAALSAAGDKPAANEKDKTDKPEAKAEAASDAAVEAAPDGVEGGDSEEPLNRGLLLKFLSSVRQ